MSKGPGRQQERILKALGNEQIWTTESLRWFLFSEDGIRELSLEGKLPTTWNTSFARAVQALDRNGKISIQSRPLETFQECVEHYPGKTLSSTARTLRTELLPLLKEWISDDQGIGPKYGVEANESHHLRSLSKEKVHELGKEWRCLEEQLRPVYGQASKAAAPILLGLICKGRSLFNYPHVSSEISARGSMGEWLKKAAGSEALPNELLENLKRFVNEFIPPSKSKALEFKSYIHQLTEIPNHGQCKLRKETLDYLHHRRPEVIESMEGFKKLERTFPSFDLPNNNRYVYPDRLDRLFDHTVFQEFDFLSLA